MTSPTSLLWLSLNTPPYVPKVLCYKITVAVRKTYINQQDKSALPVQRSRKLKHSRIPYAEVNMQCLFGGPPSMSSALIAGPGSMLTLSRNALL